MSSLLIRSYPKLVRLKTCLTCNQIKQQKCKLINFLNELANSIKNVRPESDGEYEGKHVPLYNLRWTHSRSMSLIPNTVENRQSTRTTTKLRLLASYMMSRSAERLRTLEDVQTKRKIEVDYLNMERTTKLKNEKEQKMCLKIFGTLKFNSDCEFLTYTPKLLEGWRTAAGNLQLCK